MKKAVLLAALIIFGISHAAAQVLQPSTVKHSENIGEYRKVTYMPQKATYKNHEYNNAYSISGFQLYFSPQSAVIIAPNNEEIYHSHANCDGWASSPTFYFHKNKNRPIVISVVTGMEEYWGSTIYIIDKDYKCTRAGHLDITPFTGSHQYDDYNIIENVLRLEDKGKKGICFTFACDSLLSMSSNDSRFSDVLSSKDLYFTFTSDTLVPCPKRGKLPGVQRIKLYSSIKEPVSSVHFFDVNNDGYEDMIYVLRHRKYSTLDENTQKQVRRNDSTSIVVCLRKDHEIIEELIFDFDEPIDVE
ncbi:MAG: hypothetical protein LBG19_02740 [Prevotellaceae bacterium]|jgi:hypothetical protein|nr:hypothetical protein [Prevotellaceae bacterium]